MKLGLSYKDVCHIHWLDLYPGLRFSAPLVSAAFLDDGDVPEGVDHRGEPEFILKKGKPLTEEHLDYVVSYAIPFLFTDGYQIRSSTPGQALYDLIATSRAPSVDRTDAIHGLKDSTKDFHTQEIQNDPNPRFLVRYEDLCIKNMKFDSAYQSGLLSLDAWYEECIRAFSHYSPSIKENAEDVIHALARLTDPEFIYPPSVKKRVCVWAFIQAIFSHLRWSSQAGLLAGDLVIAFSGDELRGLRKNTGVFSELKSRYPLTQNHSKVLLALSQSTEDTSQSGHIFLQAAAIIHVSYEVFSMLNGFSSNGVAPKMGYNSLSIYPKDIQLQLKDVCEILLRRIISDKGLVKEGY